MKSILKTLTVAALLVAMPGSALAQKKAAKKTVAKRRKADKAARRARRLNRK